MMRIFFHGEDLKAQPVRAFCWGALVLFLCGCGGGAFPTSRFPSGGRLVSDAWPDVGGVVLEDVASLTYQVVDDEQIVGVLNHRQRIQVLNADGLKLSRVVIPFDGYSSISGIVARSISAQGRVVRLNDSTAQIRNQDGASKPFKEVVFDVPGVTVGGVIDIRYTRTYFDHHFIPPWVFGGRLPTVRAEYVLQAPQEVKIGFRYGRGNEVVDLHPLRRNDDDGERLVFVQTDLPAFYEEPFMPHRARVGPWVASVVRRWVGDERVVRFESWDDVRDRAFAMLSKVGGKSRSKSGDARFIFQAVRDRVRVFKRPGLGLQKPLTAPEITKGRWATTRDTTALLLRWLQGAEVRAFPALVSDRRGPPLLRGFPSLYPFTKAVVAIEAPKNPACEEAMSEEDCESLGSNRYVFLDPTCQQCGYGTVGADLGGAVALVLHPQSQEWIDLPVPSPQTNKTNARYRGRLEVDGTVTASMKGDWNGINSHRLRERLSRQKNGSSRARAMNRFLYGDDAVFRLTGVEFKDRGKLDHPLLARAKLEGELARLNAERFRFEPGTVLGSVFSRMYRATRRYPALIEGPRWSEASIHLDLPAGYVAQIPPVVKLVESFAEYGQAYTQSEQRFTFSRRLVIKKSMIRAADWERFFDFYREIRRLEAEGVEIGLAETASTSPVSNHGDEM